MRKEKEKGDNAGQNIHYRKRREIYEKGGRIKEKIRLRERWREEREEEGAKRDEMAEKKVIGRTEGNKRREKYKTLKVRQNNEIFLAVKGRIE